MQLIFPLLALGIRNLKDRAALWEYLFHLTTCVTLTMFLFAWFPSNTPSTVYSFKPVVSQTTVGRHIADVRSGRMTTVDLTILEGVISLPSFHVAGAMIVTWTFRHRRWVMYPLVALNACLVAATLLLGMHYAVDVVAGALVFLASVWLYSLAGFSTVLLSDAAMQAAPRSNQNDDPAAYHAKSTTRVT
jgi:membrane-associated phospholipid phosphatase